MWLLINRFSELHDSPDSVLDFVDLNLGRGYYTTTVIIKAKDSVPYCGCFFCQGKMSSIPYTLQMSKAMNENKRSAHSGMKHGQFYDSCMGDENPTRYSSKMMNSIWGQYNELSVHNFKSLQCGGLAGAEVQDSQSLQKSQQMQQMQQQQQMQQTQAGTDRSAFGQFCGELGQAVASNFMDNMHQY